MLLTQGKQISVVDFFPPEPLTDECLDYRAGKISHICTLLFFDPPNSRNISGGKEFLDSSVLGQDNLTVARKISTRKCSRPALHFREASLLETKLLIVEYLMSSRLEMLTIDKSNQWND